MPQEKDDNPPRYSLRQALWFVVGLFALALAVIGAVLPLLPTTPFLLVAAFAFARSSEKLHRWLHDHAHFGPLILNWQRHGAISRRAKTAALGVIAATPVVSWLAGVAGHILLLQTAILAVVALFIVTRPAPPPEGGKGQR